MPTEGAVHGRYRLVRPLGRGGTGEVWLATHLELGSRHAVKILHASGPAAADRLRHEGEIQASVVHPNLVPVTDVLEVDGQPALVVEFVDGPTLDRVIASRSPLPLEQLDAIATDVLRGAAAAHAAGWVHRDLKPSNVLLDRGTARIIDFGIAAAVDGPPDDAVARGTGTRRYMSLEQALGHAAEPSFDVFALGALLFELCDGRPAFAQLTSWEDALRTGEYPVPTREDLPPRMVDAIRGALGPRERRFPDAASVLGCWSGRPTAEFRAELLARADPLTAHLDPERLVARLTPAEEAHVAVCAVCRLQRELLQRELTGSSTTSGRWSASARGRSTAPSTWRRAWGALAEALGARPTEGTPPALPAARTRVLSARTRSAVAVGACVAAAPALELPSVRLEVADVRTVGVDSPPSPWVGAIASDDRYAYLIPMTGSVLWRIDGRSALDDRAAWDRVELEAVSPGASANAHTLPGGVVAGGFLYLSPLGNGRVLRYTLGAPLTDPGAWASADVGPHPGLVGNVAFDGRFVYLGPDLAGAELRYDTTRPFTAAAFESVDLVGLGLLTPGGAADFGPTFTGDRTVPFHPDRGASQLAATVSDGRYVYLVPAYDGGFSSGVVRYDPARPFADPAAWARFDTHALGANAEGFGGAAFDGRWITFAPGFSDPDSWSGLVVRFDTTLPFDDPASWQTFDVRTVDPRATGYHGPVWDGRVLTFVPYGGGWNAVALRYDPRLPLDRPAAWTALDLRPHHSNALGFVAGGRAGDGVVLVPFNGRLGSSREPIAVRFDPLGTLTR